MKIPDSLKKAISSKVLKKAEEGDSKVSGIKELDSVSKDLAFLPNIAKDLNIARQNIFKLVKLEGGKPQRASNVSSDKANKSPSPVFKDQASMKKKEPKEESSFEKGQRFADFFLDLLSPKKILSKLTIGTIFMVAGIVTLFKDAFVGLAEYLWDAIKESFNNFVEYIGKWFNDVVKPILDELTIFMEKIWTKIKDFFKPIFDWVGQKINSILEFLEPVFNFIGKVFGKIMEYVNKFTEQLSFLTNTYNSLQNQIAAAKKSLAEASGPSSEVQYDAMGGVISDSGAEAAAEQAARKKKEEEAKAAAEQAKKKKEADDAKAAAAAKAAADAKQNYGNEGRRTPTSPSPSQGSSGRGSQGGASAAEMVKKDLTPSQLKWLGGADPTDPYIMARMPPPQPGEKGGPPVKPPPTPAAPAAPAAPAPAKPAPSAPSGGGMSDSKQMIIRHEGKAEKVPGGYKPYPDTKGYWTIGVGHLITKEKTLPKEWDRVFTEAEIMKMFDEDYAHHAAAAAKIPGFNLLSQSGQDALIDMTFNMGNNWYKNFPTAIEALAKGDFKTAADEFTNSRWYKQVKGRAVEIVALIRNSISAAPVKGDTQVAKTETPSPAPVKPAASAPSTPSAAPTIPVTKTETTGKPETKKPPGSGSLASVFDVENSQVNLNGFNPEFAKRLIAMGTAFTEKTGKKLLITSGVRDTEKQKELYAADLKANGGKPSGAVARPGTSLHEKGIAIDISQNGPAGLNTLAGNMYKNDDLYKKGWLESFGLFRPIKLGPGKDGKERVNAENWHVQPIGTMPTADNSSAAAGKDGKPIDPATGKTLDIAAAEPANKPNAGEKIAANSTSLAADQRAQQKPTTPVVIDASTTNNTQVTKNETSASKNRPDTNKLLLARAT